ncbi:MAG: hypothetical protein BECKG1743D_GA0114223_100848, partial [Candidatus Kentron sp. G]
MPATIDLALIDLDVVVTCPPEVLRPSKFEGHCPMIRHGCRMALMVALNWSVECVKEES